jgi:DNA-binding beta-propeller fold protein YncE
MNARILILIVSVLCSCFCSCKAQPSFGDGYLAMTRTVQMPGVKGRIDHMDVNVKDKIVYIAALGNNTLEVIDLKEGKVIHSIKGLDEPQGVGYIPQTNEIFVANGGNGDCYFYNAATFEKTAALHLSSDADDVRYDSVIETIYVGYGKGGIAAIDARTHRQTGNVQLPAHPEGFQLDKAINRMLVNVPDKNMIAVIDLSQLKVIDQWIRSTPTANFPMALDTIRHYAFIGYRHPARLIVLDVKTGNEISNNEMAGDIDDLYFDYQTKRLYISGGEGYINVFEQQADNRFNKIANIPSRNGARTSLFIPQLKLFVLAERAGSGNPAQLSIYNTAQ